MKMFVSTRSFAFLLLVVAFVFADESSKVNEAGAASEIKDPQPLPPTKVPSTTTSVPVTNSTTTETPTTTPLPTPTTLKPTPTTPKPTPTKPTPTTPKPTEPTTPPTTTAKPTPPTTIPTPPPTKPTPSPTTPTPAPTTPTPTPTTPTPTPTTPTPPPPAKDNWIVPGPKGTVCITANMVIKIDVPYKSMENKTVESTFKVDHIENATASGTCTGSGDENLILTWGEVSAKFTFAQNVTDHTYSLNSVNIVIAVNNNTFPNNTFPNNTMTILPLVYTGKLFSVPLNNSYTCANVEPVTLTGPTIPTTNTTVSGKLTVAHVHVQAFGNETSSKFRAPMDCASSETPDIVPIVVGLVLAGLVVVVLVAYLVGRRRAMSRGYLSM